MARDFAKDFYHSSRWLKCRQAFIKERISIDGGMCERCKKELGYIVHHKEWLSPENIDNPEITLNPDNLEYVCLCCHNKIGMDDEEDNYYFDESGNLQYRESPP